MKVKHIIALYLASFCIAILSSVFKILQLMGAPTLLLISASVLIIATVLAIWKVFTSEKFKDFLNS